MTSLSCRVGRFSICGRGAATLRVARGVRLLCVHVSVDVCQKHSTVLFFFYIFYSGTLSPTNQNVTAAASPRRARRQPGFEKYTTGTQSPFPPLVVFDEYGNSMLSILNDTMRVLFSRRDTTAWDENESTQHKDAHTRYHIPQVREMRTEGTGALFL